MRTKRTFRNKFRAERRRQTDEKATLVVTAVPNPSEMVSVQEYLHGVLPLLAGAGGTLVRRLKTNGVSRSGFASA